MVAITLGMLNRAVIVLAVVTLVGAVGLYIMYPPAPEPEVTAAFVDCLAEKGYAFGYRDTCPYCQQQKALFGDYLDRIDTHDCKTDAWCSENNISTVPTWVVASTGERLVGLQPLSRLSSHSGCGFK